MVLSFHLDGIFRPAPHQYAMEAHDAAWRPWGYSHVVDKAILASMIVSASLAIKSLHFATSTTNDVRIHRDWTHSSKILCLILFIVLEATTAVDSHHMVVWVERILSMSLMALLLVAHVLQKSNYRRERETLSVCWAFMLIRSTARLPWMQDVPLDLNILVSRATQCALAIWLFSVDCMLKPRHGPALTSSHPNASPLNTASLFSTITYGWVGKLVRKAWKQNLELEDLWDLQHEDASLRAATVFETAWATQLSKSRPSLRIALLRAFGREYAVAAVFKFLADAGSMLEPWILKAQISSLEHMAVQEGIMLSLACFINSVVQVVCKQLYFARSQLVGIHMKSALSVMLYKKSIRLTEDSKMAYPTGRLVSLLTTDLERLEYATNDAHMLWAAPLFIVVAILLLWRMVGISVGSLLPVLLVLLPIFGVCATLQNRFQRSQVNAKDARLRLTCSALSNIRSIKLHNLQAFFIKAIEAARSTELRSLRLVSLVIAFSNAILTLAPFFMSVALYASLAAWSGAILTAAMVFPPLTLLNNLQFPLTRLPGIVTSVSQALLAIDRIQDALLADETSTESFLDNWREEHVGGDNVVASGALFSWSRGTLKASLEIDDLRAQSGDVLCIVGPVGSGKSTLLQALLRNLERISGNIHVRGSVAYFPQQAWLLNVSVRQNITFGNSWDSELYERVIQACVLEDDLRALPYGDETLVSDGATSLSGGQKARVMLARCIYSQADVYLLDDCLAALDMRVAMALVERVLGPNGVLRKKTVVMVTAFVPALSIATEILALQEGRIAERGTYLELFKRQAPAVSFLEMGSSSHTTIKKQASEQTLMEQELCGTHEVPEDDPYSTADDASQTEQAFPANSDSEKQRPGETQAVGAVSREVYKRHIMSAGVPAVILSLLFGVAAQATNIGTTWWLNAWANANEKAHFNVSLNSYLTVYIAIGASATLFFWLTNVLVVSYSSVRVSALYHRQLLGAVLGSPMWFFETTPLGRILNRFSGDMTRVDDTIPDSIFTAFKFLSKALFLLATIVAVAPALLALALPLTVIYIWIHRCFLQSCRTMTRLCQIANSSVLSLLEQCITGADVIRAFGKETYTANQYHAVLDDFVRCRYLMLCLQRWLAIRIEFLGSIVVFGTALISILGTSAGRLSISVSALILSSALQITTLLSLVVQRMTIIENSLVSEERILEYINTEAEGNVIKGSPKRRNIPASWPSSGLVEFKNYSARYRPGLPYALKNISLTIKSGEKIGIMGRTGAGKSSLIQALFRLLEAESGSICIDGLDVSKIELERLRASLAIIPQEPFIFHGTVRENLDPSAEFEDTQIWDCLAQTGLLSTVANMPDGLDTIVGSEGGKLSQGHRQLLALARAFLSRAKIVVLDEATSAIDKQTEQLVQQTLRGESFAEKTLIIIAHRLDTIAHCHRIVTLQDGAIVGVGEPREVLDGIVD